MTVLKLLLCYHVHQVRRESTGIIIFLLLHNDFQFSKTWVFFLWLVFCVILWCKVNRGDKRGECPSLRYWRFILVAMNLWKESILTPSPKCVSWWQTTLHTLHKHYLADVNTILKRQNHYNMSLNIKHSPTTSTKLGLRSGNKKLYNTNMFKTNHLFLNIITSRLVSSFLVDIRTLGHFILLKLPQLYWRRKSGTLFSIFVYCFTTHTHTHTHGLLA